MGDVVNLNKFRKTRAKAEAEERAQTNRVRYGLTKGEKTRQKAEADKRETALDGHNLGQPGDGER